MISAFGSRSSFGLRSLASGPPLPSDSRVPFCPSPGHRHRRIRFSVYTTRSHSFRPSPSSLSGQRRIYPVGIFLVHFALHCTARNLFSRKKVSGLDSRKLMIVNCPSVMAYSRVPAVFLRAPGPARLPPDPAQKLARRFGDHARWLSFPMFVMVGIRNTPF